MKARHGTRTGEVSAELVRPNDVAADSSSQTAASATNQRFRPCRKRTSG